ncbi:hypothetical protein [Natronobiforma cellulositropha]|uniref:hypothetical protein n=1 Tax=Natronobiforma cellulositropha TaxID=1679076 RepID=UPI0021D5F54E|nr:hypothetical protein [Natronobiforma cellulositropha]
MIRPLLLAFAALEVAVPDRIVSAAERVAFENPDDGILRPWTLPMARLEGLCFGWLALSGRLHSPTVSHLFGALGLALLSAPRSALAAGLAVAYENPDEIEVRPWVVPFARALGVCYLVVALFSGRAGEPTDDPETATGE